MSGMGCLPLDSILSLLLYVAEQEGLSLNLSKGQ